MDRLVSALLQHSNTPALLVRANRQLNFLAMSGFVVFVSLAVSFIPGLFMRTVAEWLILRQAAHADPNRFVLRLYFERTLVSFDHFAHDNL